MPTRKIILQPYNTPESPCQDCEFRTVTCHSSCERYLKYRAEIDKGQKEKFKRQASYRYFYAQRVTHLDEKSKAQKRKSQRTRMRSGGSK